MIQESKKVQRINFIEREPFVISYQKMMTIVLAVVGLCGFFYGLQAAQCFWLEKQSSEVEKIVTDLKRQREIVLKQRQSENFSARLNSLITIFDESPSWSIIFREITSKTPHALWLTSIKSGEQTVAKTKPKSQDKDSPAPETKRINLSLMGQANEAESVAVFLKSLSDSKYFEEVTLITLQQEEGNNDGIYKFSLNLLLKENLKKEIN